MPQPNVVVRIFGPKSQQAFSAMTELPVHQRTHRDVQPRLHRQQRHPEREAGPCWRAGAGNNPTEICWSGDGKREGAQSIRLGRSRRGIRSSAGTLRGVDFSMLRRTHQETTPSPESRWAPTECCRPILRSNGWVNLGSQHSGQQNQTTNVHSARYVGALSPFADHCIGAKAAGGRLRPVVPHGSSLAQA